MKDYFKKILISDLKDVTASASLGYSGSEFQSFVAWSPFILNQDLRSNKRTLPEDPRLHSGL